MGCVVPEHIALQRMGVWPEDTERFELEKERRAARAQLETRLALLKKKLYVRCFESVKESFSIAPLERMICARWRENCRARFRARARSLSLEIVPKTRKTAFSIEREDSRDFSSSTHEKRKESERATCRA